MQVFLETLKRFIATGSGIKLSSIKTNWNIYSWQIKIVFDATQLARAISQLSKNKTILHRRKSIIYISNQLENNKQLKYKQMMLDQLEKH